MLPRSDLRLRLRDQEARAAGLWLRVDAELLPHPSVGPYLGGVCSLASWSPCDPRTARQSRLLKRSGAVGSIAGAGITRLPEDCSLDAEEAINGEAWLSRSERRRRWLVQESPAETALRRVGWGPVGPVVQAVSGSGAGNVADSMRGGSGAACTRRVLWAVGNKGGI